MDIIELTADNLAGQHIGCAIGNTPDAKRCAEAKKAWMMTEFGNGFRFFRLDAQGKALIETIPAENAWSPIDADGWLFIDCFWVSGKFKGTGAGKRLLQTARAQAKQQGKKGLVAVSSNKKQPFLSDAGFYRHQGFVLADTAPPYYELLALPLAPKAPLPQFLPVAKTGAIQEKGIVLFYSHHCPHTAKYVPLVQAAAQGRGAPFAAKLLHSAAQARAVPNPFPSYALFYDGAFVTNEIFSPAKMEKFLDEQGF